MRWISITNWKKRHGIGKVKAKVKLLAEKPEVKIPAKKPK